MDPRTDSILFPIPTAAGVTVRRNQSCPNPLGGSLEYDLYLPPDAPSSVVVFVHGDSSPERIRGAKDWAQFMSWGQLMAASGLAAVTFNRRSTGGGTCVAEAEAEVRAMLDHLHQHATAYGLQPWSFGVWVCSAGPLTVIPMLLRERLEYVRCVAVYYGLLDVPAGPAAEPVAADPAAGTAPESAREYSAVGVLERLQDPSNLPAMLLVRAGRDRPQFNQSIDRFLETALQRGLSVELFNHPDGDHAFDVRNDGPRTREAIAGTIDFFRWHLCD